MIEEGLFHLIDPHLFRMALFRWLDILGVVLWVGAIGFRRLIFLPSLRVIDDPGKKSRLEGEEFSHTYSVLFFTLLYLLAVHCLTLVHQAGMMSGRPLQEIISVLPLVLQRTHFGMVWITKLFLLIFLLVLTIFRLKSQSTLLLCSGLLLCLTGTLSGHAVSRDSSWGVILSDCSHYIAVSIWTGGLLPLRRIARRSARLLNPAMLASFLEKTITTFSAWAVLCVMVITLTGMMSALVYFGWEVSLAFLYGKVLLLKLILVCFVLLLGGVSRFYILPSFQKIREGRGIQVFDLERRFSYAVSIEIGFAIATLVLAALLTQTPPPHLGP